MRVPDSLLSAVGFVCYRRQDRVVEEGTGFFLGFPSERKPGELHPYFVTARHLVKPKQGGPPPGRPMLRLNRQDGTAGLIDIEGKVWWHSNESDVSVLPIDPPDEFDVLGITTDDVLDRPGLLEHGIGVGDSLATIGLFSKYPGKEVIRPIVRTGTIAAMPGEPLRDAYGNNCPGYLAEIRSVSGFSGSPVLTFMDPHRQHPERRGALLSQWSVYLLGVMRGHWDLETSDDVAWRDMNAGIAIVTPIHDVLDLLRSSKLVEQRKRSDDKHNGEAIATAD